MSFWVFIAVMALWTAAFFAPNLRWGRKDVMKDGKRQPAPRDEWPLMYRLRELENEVAKLRREADDEHSQWFYRRLESEIRGTAPAFKNCRTLRDVFNLYDSMEGRALAAEERIAEGSRRD
jgi:hypothetical protein